MDLAAWTTVVVALISGVLGALATAARAGRAQESATRDIGDARARANDAHARLAMHDQRIALLETTKAVDEERWRRVEELLNELRRDVKELKGR